MATSTIKATEDYNILNPSSGSGYVYFSNAKGNNITSTMMPLINSANKVITLLSVTLPNSSTIGVSRFTLVKRITGFCLVCADEVSAAACENKMCYVEFNVAN